MACVPEIIALSQTDAQYYREEILRTEQLTMDYLHQLELETTSYHDRAKIASALRVARQQRRTAKDSLETSEPMLTFAESERGKTLINQLKEVLGRTRKAEKLVQNPHICRGYYLQRSTIKDPKSECT